MTQYRLVFESLDVARIKPADDPSSAPVAWLRLLWGSNAAEIAAVHVYGHAEAVGDRPWLATCGSIADAVAYCDRLPVNAPDEIYDWSGGSLESSSPER